MNLSLRHYYRRWLKNLVILFALTAILMTGARLGFVLHFGNVNSLLNEKTHLLEAFFLGLRYDLIPLSYIYAVPFLVLHLLYLFPGRASIKLTRFVLITLLAGGYFLLLWLFVFDYAFYSYFQDHLNILFFGFFEDDTIATLISIWKNYNLPVWLTGIFFVHYAIYKVIKFVFSMFDFDLRAPKLGWRFGGLFVTGVIFLALCARGNFTRLPLSLEDAHISGNEFINELSLNGVITLNRAIRIRRAFGKGKVNYIKKYGFKSWEEAYGAAFPTGLPKKDLSSSLLARTRENEFLKKHPPHVVLVVMESFGSYWIPEHTKNFNILGDLDRHLKEGILFNNFLPAENGTIGSIVSVATSQVIRPGARFLSESEFMKTSLASAGQKPYKDAGYDTHFVYGGKLGWRELGKYLGAQGYDRLWGAEEIKESMPELQNISDRELGNEWGIFDEYLYSFIEEQLRTSTKPQFFLVLTTSNHPPFEFPTNFETKPLEFPPAFTSRLTIDEDLARKRFLGMQYANQKMAEFISRVKTSAFKDQTILALTGDHSFWIANEVGGDQEFRRYAVPFFLSLPEAYRPQNVDTMKFGSHEDIFPSLFHLSLSGQAYVKLGENVFSDESHAMNSSGLVANEDGAYHNGKYWIWKDLKKQILERTEETPVLNRLRRHAQGLIGITDLYLKGEKESKRSDEGNDRR